MREEKKQVFFTEEAFCRISGAKVVQIRTSQQVRQSCPKQDFYFREFILQVHKETYRVIGTLESKWKDCGIQG